MPQPRELTVELPALTVSALAWGPEDGPLALCLHGFPDTAWTWRHLGPELAERGWRVVAPFTRGYAPTGPAPDGDYRVGALITDALDLCRALGSDDRAGELAHRGLSGTAQLVHDVQPASRRAGTALRPAGAAAVAALVAWL